MTWYISQQISWNVIKKSSRMYFFIVSWTLVQFAWKLIQVQIILYWAFKYFKAPQQYWYKRNAFINFFLNLLLSSSPNTLYLEEKTSSVSFNGCNDVKGHTYWKLCTKIPKLYSILYMRESDLITFRNGFKGKVLYQFSFGWVLWN